MKRILIILAVLLFASCENNSFEDYNSWCNEVIEKEKVVFEFDLEHHYAYGIYINDSTFKEVEVTDLVMDLNNPNPKYTLGELNYFLDMAQYRVSDIKLGIEQYQEKRCIATIEGYNEWLKDR